MMSLTTGDLKYLTSDMTLRMEIAWRSAPDRVALGKLADMFDLGGAVPLAKLKLLVAGKDPKTGKAIVRGARGLVVRDDGGELKDRVERREGWDATISAPKSVSEFALIAGDERFLTAHREAVAVTLAEAEKFAMVRTNSNGTTVLTGNLCIVQFEHHTARPVEGFVAPQLHTHNLIINMTQVGEGKYQALEPRGIYEAQHYLTTVYRAALAEQVLRLGYRIEIKESGAWELAGYDPAYLAALSPRSAQRDVELARKELSYSPMAARYAVLQTREGKQTVDPETLMESWQEKAQTYRANEWRPRGKGPVCLWVDDRNRRRLVAEAVTHAIAVTMARTGQSDELTLLIAALKFDLGRIPLLEAKAELAGRIALGEVIVQEMPRPGKLWSMMTTPEHERLWAEVVRRSTAEVTPSGVESEVGIHLATEPVEAILGARIVLTMVERRTDQVIETAIDAGIRFQTGGYRVVGVSDSQNTRDHFRESGFEAVTLAEAQPDLNRPTVFVVAADSVKDLAGLAGFLRRLRPEDRVVVARGRNQKNELLDRLGQELVNKMKVNHLKEIKPEEHVKQTVKSPKEYSAVELERMRRSGQVVEAGCRDIRMEAFVSLALNQSDNGIAFSADPAFRVEATEKIRAQLIAREVVGPERRVEVLVRRDDLTGNARSEAERYDLGNVVEYAESSAQFLQGERVRVIETAPRRLTVERQDGTRVTYDPARLRGVAVYEQKEMRLGEGDRIVVATKGKNLPKVAKIEALNDEGAEIRYSTGLKEHIRWSDGVVVGHGVVVDPETDVGSVDSVVIEAGPGMEAPSLNKALSHGLGEALVVTSDWSAIVARAEASENLRAEERKPFVLKECPNGPELAVDVRVHRLITRYERLHEELSGETYRGVTYSEGNLKKYVLGKDDGAGMAKIANLDRMEQRIAEIESAPVINQVKFVREIMVLDGEAIQGAEQKIQPALFRTASRMPVEKQTRMAIAFVAKVLEENGFATLTRREAQILEEQVGQSRIVKDNLGPVAKGHQSVLPEPEQDLEALIGLGLLTGHIGGFPANRDTVLDAEVAQTMNQLLKNTGESIAQNHLKGLTAHGVVMTLRQVENPERVVILTVPAAVKIDENELRHLKENFSTTESVYLIPEARIGNVGVEQLKAAAHRSETMIVDRIERRADGFVSSTLQRLSIQTQEGKGHQTTSTGMDFGW